MEIAIPPMLPQRADNLARDSHTQRAKRNLKCRYGRMNHGSARMGFCDTRPTMQEQFP
jgi:hypothetical protein